MQNYSDTTSMNLSRDSRNVRLQFVRWKASLNSNSEKPPQPTNSTPPMKDPRIKLPADVCPHCWERVGKYNFTRRHPFCVVFVWIGKVCDWLDKIKQAK